MHLFKQMLRRDAQQLYYSGVRVRVLGRLQELSAEVQRALKSVMDFTSQNSRLTLNLCINYGGRAELVDALRGIMAAGYDPLTVTEEVISAHLYTRDLPEPDLIIRTGGEMRSSNFLLWQSAYSEYYSTPVLWPDFSEEDFRGALLHYQQRKRRFGGRLPYESDAIPSSLKRG